MMAGLTCCTATAQALLSSMLVDGSLVDRIRSMGSVMRTRRPTGSRARWCRASSALRLRLSARRIASADLHHSKAHVCGNGWRQDRGARQCWVAERASARRATNARCRSNSWAPGRCDVPMVTYNGVLHSCTCGGDLAPGHGAARLLLCLLHVEGAPRGAALGHAPSHIGGPPQLVVINQLRVRPAHRSG